MQSHMPGKEVMKDIIQWDIQTWSRAVAFWEDHVDWNSTHKGLEIGGRQGGLSLWMAMKGMEVVCSDLEGVKETATPLHEKYKITDKIQYRDIDATSIPYENYFDIICFKSVIGGVGRDGHPERQQKAFDEIYKALKPGGKLLFAENLVASPLHHLMRKMFVRWGGSWRYVTIPELKTFTKHFSKTEIHSTGVLSAFGRSETQRNFLASLDRILFNHICPAGWRYVAFGYAVK